ncbi:3-deoxy-D-manno-octulosonic acid kinase [Pseudoalteromonas sp. NEC-BIFX-2020_015]|uniref:3-deoxy-D-manno-octulosonic acid kinase n=1 Tax=Pseudoalteromonas sp. NEC-BIFX-2020_015 TaxID=2729544 RepID=UPI00146147F3|nr:3-deoxy-D-manno-octulosonic acid kinase [Pseudoalteromonas sp. NEC-BIFX-2020_015]NMR24507.1 3-deoxy-D-manno-octulosonic acid kinase [Pseudoalteromonas sp. NEC-BIFX-2020_015]
MFNQQTINEHILLSHPEHSAQVSLNWFDNEYWQQQKKIVGTKKGRATAWFFCHDKLTAVLRHYWRGGLVGKVLSDQYLYLGLEKTRVYQEFNLMMKLTELGLNVPKPIAAKVSKCGLIYRGDLITQAITGAQSLLDVLKQRSFTKQEVIKVANTIADFHNHGVYHADLNINNILFDETGEVYIIDFDRGELKTPAKKWQQANMARLARSFNKEQGRNQVMHWQQNDWQHLEYAYQSALRD